MSTIPIQVEVLDERYAGELTGRTVYHTSTIGTGLMGAVLGRGYTVAESLKDFVSRAKADGYDVVLRDLDDPKVIDRRNPGSGGVKPGIRPPGSLVD